MEYGDEIQASINAKRSFQEKGKAKLRSKQGFTLFKEQLKQQGISSKYIKENQELLKKKYKESGLAKMDFEE